MSRLLTVGILLLVGCQGTVGPRQRALQPQKVDAPCTPIDEQMRKGRDQLAFPDGSGAAGPRTYAEVPGANGP